MGRKISLHIFLVLALVITATAQTSDDLDQLKSRAQTLFESQKYAEANTVAKEAFDTSVSLFGEMSTSTSYCAWMLANTYKALGNFDSAQTYYELCVKIDESVRGPDHPETAMSMSNLAEVQRIRGNYDSALSLYKRSIPVLKDSLGPEHPAYAICLNNAALVHKLRGEFELALPLYKESLQILETSLGPKHPSSAGGLNNLGTLYVSMGNYESALPLLERSLAVREETVGKEHPATAESLNNLAELYRRMGDYERAASLFRKSLAIQDNVLGPNHPETALLLNNLASLQETMGNYSDALPLYQRSLKIREEALGPEHPTTAQSLNNLAGLRKAMGEFREALTLYQRSLDILEESVGPKHSDYGLSLNNVAGIYELLGDYEKALTLYERSLAVLRSNFPEEHPSVSSTLQNLAYLHLDLGSPEQSLLFAKRAASGEFANTHNVFTFASERQRLAHRKTHHPYSLFGTHGSAVDLLDQSLRYKGLVLDSIVEDQRLAEASGKSETREIVSQLKAVKSQLNQLYFESSDELDQETRPDRVARLQNRYEKLQSQLAREGAAQGRLRRAFTVTPDQVQEAMPSGSVLVEYLRYHHYLGGDRWEARYGAVVLPERGQALWAPLPGSAKEIEGAVARYKAFVREGKSGGRFALDYSTETTTENASTLLTELYEVLWAPVDEKIPAGSKTVVVSPDGELSFISFATLMSPSDDFLAEKYDITYVSSGRDLLAEKRATKDKSQILVGDPDFGSELRAAGQPSALFSDGWQGLNFVPLPYTRSECEGLKQTFLADDVEVSTLLGKEASEARVRALRSPQTLHLATHGFFLPDSSTGDPMYRSGLALAGAQSTIELRAEGQSPAAGNDGLLTAAEVGVLDLQGTNLVTLSACDTGSGESRAGEGVLGLRRGFVQAGAQSLVLTLWPVADQETSSLMQEFYRQAKDRPAPLAMAEVQRKWLLRLRKERSLEDAVRLAGPFVLSFQGQIDD